MSDTLDALKAFVALILIAIFGWAFYTGLVMILLVGVCTLSDIIFGHFVNGIPFPDWWLILIGISSVIGIIEFYENIVRNP